MSVSAATWAPGWLRENGSSSLRRSLTGGRSFLRLTDCAFDVGRALVRDTGRGIRKDVLPIVFQRFRQGDSSTTRTEGGLGIGLAIVGHLVELHGGTVSASSAGEGSGSTFTITLPVRAIAMEEPRPAWAAAGYQLHVAKPVDPGELAVRVAHLAGRPGANGAAGRSELSGANAPL